MTSRDIANRFREERYTLADMQSVTKALENCDARFLDDVIASYIKYGDKLDERALIQYLKIAQAFWPVHEIISGLSTLRCKSSEFATEVLRYAEGTSWDKEGYARIAAIAALPRILENDRRVQSVLKAAVKSDNIVVTNVALEAAQEFLGTPVSKIVRGLTDEDLAQRVPREVQEWLGL
jgi:hypothetical protein